MAPTDDEENSLPATSAVTGQLRPSPPPSRLSRILWGTALRARPTLRGLLAVQDSSDPGSGPAEFFPWQQLHTHGDYGFWSVLDEHGRPLKRDGRPVSLQVKGWHAKRVAKRLQKRHLRHAWDDGTLSVTADLSRDLSPRWPVVVLALFWVAILTMMFWSIWRTPARPPFWQGDSPVFVWFDKRSLMWFFWVICVLAACLFCGTLWRSVSKINTTWIRLQRTGVTATLKDGSTVLRLWDSLTSIGFSFGSLPLRFGTNTPLRLPLGRCALVLRPVLNTISENVLKKPAGHEGELTRSEAVRIGLYCLTGCVVGGLLMLTLPPEARQMCAFEAFGMLAFCLGAIWATLATTVFLSPALAKKCTRWQRRRRRKLGRAKTAAIES